MAFDLLPGNRRNGLAYSSVQQFDIIIQFRDLQYDTNNYDELMLASETLEAVAHGFMVYAKLFYHFDDFTEEKAFLTDVSKVSKAIFNIRTVKSNCLRSALQMYEECASHCSRRNDVILNKGINHKVIDLAREYNDIADYAKRVKKSLSNI